MKLRDPSCDVSCISTNIQDGGQHNISNQNMYRNKADSVINPESVQTQLCVNKYNSFSYC